MGIPGAANPLLLRRAAVAAADDAYQIKQSLRFNEADSPELKMVTSGLGNRRKFTLAWWQKDTLFQGDNDIWSGGNTSGHGIIIRGNYDQSGSAPTGTLFIGEYNSSWDWYIYTNRVFRDPGAWMHFCIAFDSYQATDSDRVKLYINGKQQTSFTTTGGWPSQYHQFAWNTAGKPIGLGGLWNDAFGVHFDGYIADAYHIDNLALSPAAFGKFTSSGSWDPVEFNLPAPNDGTTWSSYGTWSGDSSTDRPNAFDDS